MELNFGNESTTKSEKLKINQQFAAKYQKRKERQELEKLKQKYGENEEESDSSSSESEDEDAEGLTPQIERDFLKTLALIKNQDPKIYDDSARFYQDEDHTDSEKNGKEDSKKPMFLKDYERKRLLDRGVKALVSDSESDDEDFIGDKLKNEDLTYTEEQKRLKQSFKVAVEESESESDDGEFLTVRKKSASEKEQEEEDYDKWLASNQDTINKLWSSDNIEEDDAFLRDYILKKEYHDKEEDSVPAYADIVDGSDDSDDDVEKQEEFERKFNFRYEEPDEEFIKTYPRTVKDSVRRTDDTRSKKRQQREARKKKEKEVKKEELKKLKNLKRKEIMEKIEKIKEITGNSKVGFLEDDLDGDFDPKKYDELMKEVYDNEYYNAEDDQEKPEFSDNDDDEFYDNWDEWTGEYSEQAHDMSEPHCEDPDFNMDADYVPTKKGSKKTLGRHSSKLSQALTKKKPVFNPEEKTFEEYFDEYYKLDYEDVIGDLPVRFKYREVMSNNFGLSTEEILQAEDKELNQWCSLKKTCKYLTKEEEMRERQRYKKKSRSQQRKSRVFASIYGKQGDDVENKTADPQGNGRISKVSYKSQLDVPLKAKGSRFGTLKSGFSTGLKKRQDALGTKRQWNFKKKHDLYASKLSAKRLAAYGLGSKRKKNRETAEGK